MPPIFCYWALVSCFAAESAYCERMKSIFLFATILFLGAAELRACTTFCFQAGDSVIFGRNYDWMVGDGMVILNKRNVSKTAMHQDGEGAAKWMSKYGSLTFNQYGREFPTGGINETGLVVELMMLQGSKYPARDARSVVGGLEWIQYQLDTSKSISDVLQSADKVRISSSIGLHFLICESSGSCMTAEFLTGRFTPHSGGTLPVAALTNDSYENSLQYLKTLNGFGGTNDPADGPDSLARFGRAATLLKALEQKHSADPVNDAFGILANVAQGNSTRWSIVYDLKKLTVYFRTSASQSIKRIDLQKLDFDCQTNVLSMNIDSPKSGDANSRLLPYTEDLDRNLIRKSYKQTSFLSDTPDQEIEEIVHHPDSFTCAPK